MDIGRKRIRRTYLPLTQSNGVVCDTPDSSPMVQVYNAESNTYEPNRQLIACVVRPVICLKAGDGSMNEPIGNKSLANIKWYANGVDISTIDVWQDGYSINTTSTDEHRGTLTVTRNIPPGERWELKMEAVVNDPRTNTNVPVSTGPVMMYTTDKSKDAYSLNMSGDRICLYDPLNDVLADYEYEDSHGLDVAAAATLGEAQVHPTAYLMRRSLMLSKGGVEVAAQTTNGSTTTDNWNLEVYHVNASTGALTILDADEPNELVDITPVDSSDRMLYGKGWMFRMDCRLIEGASYMVIAKIGGTEVGRVPFAVRRQYNSYKPRTENDNYINSDENRRIDHAHVQYNGRVMAHPERSIRMVWMTAVGMTETAHGEGTDFNVPLGELGMTDSIVEQMEMWLNVAQKDRHALAVDENGAVLTDSDGTPLIFN